MAISATESARRQSVLLAALQCLAKKGVLRDHLAVGSTPVQGVINATVGRAIVELPFSGLLQVGAEQTRSKSSGPDAAHVITLATKEMSDNQRVRFFEKLIAHFENKGTLPPVDADRLEVTRAMLAKIRAKETQTIRGSVTFQSTPPAAEQKAAA